MAEHPNVTAIRRGYEAFAAGDMATLRDTWTEDIIWHVKGAGQLGGDYLGPDEVFGFLGKLAEETGGTFRLDVHAILADDEHGAVLATAIAERHGKSLSSQVVHVLHASDGKTREFWVATTDPAATLDFWQ
jgi:ketosteroid isomerase-like protein